VASVMSVGVPPSSSCLSCVEWRYNRTFCRLLTLRILPQPIFIFVCLFSVLVHSLVRLNYPPGLIVALSACYLLSFTISGPIPTHLCCFVC
jgi:hypothetical protein